MIRLKNRKPFNNVYLFDTKVIALPFAKNQQVTTSRRVIVTYRDSYTGDHHEFFLLWHFIISHTYKNNM